MPTLSVNPMPAFGWVRINQFWPENSGLQFAKLERVDIATGEVTPIRPHTDYQGWYQRLSGSHAIQYDTEAPVDRPFTYRVSPLGEDVYYYGPWPGVRDLFTRSVANDWGTAESGQVWTLNTPAAHSVVGNQGRQAHTAVNTLHTALVEVGSREQRIQVDVQHPVVPTGAAHSLWLLGNAIDGSNYYAATLQIGTSGVAGFVLQQRLGGSLQPALASVGNVGTHAANNFWRIILWVTRDRIRAMAWNLTTDSPPSTWQIDVATPLLYAGGTKSGVQSRLETGSTNATPVNVAWDGFTATGLSAESAQQFTLNSEGGFWLRSPLKPYKDVRVVRTLPRSCPPGEGVFFASMDARETYEGNSSILQPVNRRLGTAITRPRRGLSSTLNLVSRTFADRDRVLDALSDGSPLQWTAPPEYGIATQYMGIGHVDVQRGMADHRFQARIIPMPFTQVAQPPGPAAGVTGVRYGDLCSVGGGSQGVLFVQDTYDRDVAPGGWGAPNVNPENLAWFVNGGPLADYSVISANSAGRIAISGGTPRHILLPVARQNLGAKMAFVVPVVPTGAGMEVSILLRANAAGTQFLYARAEFTTTGTVRTAAFKWDGTTTTTLAAAADVPGLVHTAGNAYWLQAEVFYNRIRLKVWDTDLAEPSTWHAFAIDGQWQTISGDHAGVRSQLFAGHTMTLPVNVDVRHFEAYALDTYGPDAAFATWDNIVELGYSYNDLITLQAA